MANFYENYQIPYDFNQVNNNLYDNNNHYQYHYQQQQQEIAYDPMSYNYYYNWNGSDYEYESQTNSASVAYSVSTMSEPNHLFYDPSYYTTYETPSQLRIYCSVQGFNEPEFDEYDPTPYGGGYDMVATYGKPLTPSDKTCYPSSTNALIQPPSPPEIITPVPLGIYDGGQKNVGKKRVTFSEPLEDVQPLKTIKEDDHKKEEEDYDDDDEEDDEEEEVEEEEDDSSRYGTGNSEAAEKNEVRALYVPSGYGLEATDLCEVIFGGYFPCVLRNKRRKEDEDRAAAVSSWESNDSDPWKTTSDYLFGDSYPYGNENWSERRQFEISSYGYRSY
ncbi:unnamed protein product [Cochlearia groenlandica]